MQSTGVPVNRTLVGILGLACLGIGAALWLTRGSDDLFTGGFVRTGLLLSALWIALPSRNREAAWANVSPYTIVGVVLAAVLLIRHLRVLLPLVVVIVTVGYFLRPRGRSKARINRR